MDSKVLSVVFRYVSSQDPEAAGRLFIMYKNMCMGQLDAKKYVRRATSLSNSADGLR
jgi:hypothetical protein